MTSPADLLDAVVAFIATYRSAGLDAWGMQRAVLAAFPQANATDYARGLVEANRRRSIAADG